MLQALAQTPFEYGPALFPEVNPQISGNLTGKTKNSIYSKNSLNSGASLW